MTIPAPTVSSVLTSPRRGTAGVRAAVATSLLLLPLAACGEDTPDSPAAVGLSATPPATATPEPRPSDDPSDKPSDDPSAKPSPKPSEDQENGAPLGRSVGLTAYLLPAAELPGPNDAFRWRETTTTSAEPEDVGTCLRFALTSIGAEEVGYRSYAPKRQVERESAPYAGHVVGRFPDRMTARRARVVLMSWRDSCQDRLDDAGRKGEVGSLVTVTDAGGRAAWYLTTMPLKRSDTALIEATGFVKVRDRISVVVMRHEGQDYDYPAGEEPMVAALKRAGSLLRG